MPFIPHTQADVAIMLAAIGVDSIDELFTEIPVDLQSQPPSTIPEGMSEQEVTRLARERARRDGESICFIGAGAYDHHIPAAVWEIASRGEFYSAYTPYQAEASQGTLQLLYEFQTMISELTALPVANASLYDGASALAEAILMAVRANRNSRSRRIAVPETLNPRWREVVASLVTAQGVELVELPLSATGTTDPQQLAGYDSGQLAAVVVVQPNYFGQLEAVDQLTDGAHSIGALTIAVVNPVAMALLAPPGEWGERGADIAVGEGQPLGIPLSSGGPYLGFVSCRQEWLRQLPGRIVGRTVDAQGEPAYALTLQAREQHIRRGRATSNICTNQGLMATAATIHMALLGGEGLRRTALACHQNSRYLLEQLCSIDGVEPLFDGPFFHELVLRIDGDLPTILRALAVQGIEAGVALASDYPAWSDALLVCATEARSRDEIDLYARNLERIMRRQRPFVCPSKRPPAASGGGAPGW